MAIKDGSLEISFRHSASHIKLGLLYSISFLFALFACSQTNATENSMQSSSNLATESQNITSIDCEEAYAKSVAQRRTEAMKVFEKYPKAINKNFQEHILSGQVSIGMDPYMAALAAGSFSFKVQPDPDKWNLSEDPYRIIYAQPRHPDNSHIWMIFKNNTQYPEQGFSEFQVHIEKGVVVDVTNLGSVDCN